MMSQFFQARGFDSLVARGNRIGLTEDGLWLPVFKQETDALAFARYVGGYVRRVIERTTTSASAKCCYDQCNRAVLSIQISGWGREEGEVLCLGSEVAGLGLTCHPNYSLVLLPLKQHKYTVRTQSGSLYLGFVDGTGFCRSVANGPHEPAAVLYFTGNFDEASDVQLHGGALRVVAQPKGGLCPVYVVGTLPKLLAPGVLEFAPRAFRLGTRVVSITPA